MKATLIYLGENCIASHLGTFCLLAIFCLIHDTKPEPLSLALYRLLNEFSRANGSTLFFLRDNAEHVWTWIWRRSVTFWPSLLHKGPKCNKGKVSKYRWFYACHICGAPICFAGFPSQNWLRCRHALLVREFVAICPQSCSFRRMCETNWPCIFLDELEWQQEIEVAVMLRHFERRWTDIIQNLIPKLGDYVDRPPLDFISVLLDGSALKHPLCTASWACGQQVLTKHREAPWKTAPKLPELETASQLHPAVHLGSSLYTIPQMLWAYWPRTNLLLQRTCEFLTLT